MYRMYSTVAVIFFTLVFGIASVKAIDTNIKVGKYRVGINYSPLIACAVWPSDVINKDTSLIRYKYRAANSKEYLQLSISVLGFSVDEMVKEFEKVPSTRPLTDTEKVFCKEIAQSDLPVLKAVPSKSGTRRTRDITASTYTDMRVPDTVLCGLMVKKYRNNSNWHIIKGIPDKTTLCGNF